MLDQVDDKFVKELTNIATNHKGKNKLKLEIRDIEERLMLPMYSRSFKINVNNKLIEKLESMSIQYSLD